MSRLAEILTAILVAFAITVVLIFGLRHYAIEEYKAVTERDRVEHSIEKSDNDQGPMYETCIKVGLGAKYCSEHY